MATFMNHKIVMSWMFVFLFCSSSVVFADDALPEISEYSGVVLNKATGNPMPFANVIAEGTNISTVTNSDGKFLIKVPRRVHSISFRFIGFKSVELKLDEFQKSSLKVEMEPVATELPEISVISKDAISLVKAMFDQVKTNYPDNAMDMTAFYRETIKKNRSYASLSEAVVDIYKQSYRSRRSDVLQLFKARKKTDYNKVDTLVFKLQGGPFTSLYLDLIKNPDMIFTDEIFANYAFTFDRSTHLDNRLIYVVDFKQMEYSKEPLYYGKLYIDAQTMALKTAEFSLNLDNRDEAADMFIVKKPLNAKIYPVQANYRVDYLEKDGKWYFGYSRAEVGLRINWKKKLFRTTYYSTIEMAVTDRHAAETDKPVLKDKLNPRVVISDEAKGFADPGFWGAYNVIEPEKPIESAIKKIQKQLEKDR